MDDLRKVNRRHLLGAAAGAGLVALLPDRAAHAADGAVVGSLTPLGQPGFELVLNIVATCSDPVATGGPDSKKPSRDGIRDEIWPIIGGKFWGKGIKGTVVPGGRRLPGHATRRGGLCRCTLSAADR